VRRVDDGSRGALGSDRVGLDRTLLRKRTGRLVRAPSRLVVRACGWASGAARWWLVGDLRGVGIGRREVKRLRNAHSASAGVREFRDESSRDTAGHHQSSADHYTRKRTLGKCAYQHQSNCGADKVSPPTYPLDHPAALVSVLWWPQECGSRYSAECMADGGGIRQSSCGRKSQSRETEFEVGMEGWTSQQIVQG